MLALLRVTRVFSSMPGSGLAIGNGNHPRDRRRLQVGRLSAPYEHLATGEGSQMTTIATVLKHEITRLARKEVRALTAATRKASTQYRRDIAELKRQVRALSTQVAYLDRQERKRAAKPVPEASAKGKRFSADGLRAHRSRVDLSAADYAELVGVSGQTIYNWESGQSKPRPQQLAALGSSPRHGKARGVEATRVGGGLTRRSRTRK